MRNVFILFCIISFLSCDSDSGSDCFKKQGEFTSEIRLTEDFNRISISEGVELWVEEADEYQVRVEIGKNLMDAIYTEVLDGELIIENDNRCSMLRNYHPAKIYVKTPDLKKIYSASDYSLHAVGVLRFPVLTLESGIKTKTASSVFEMEIENQKLIVNDNISSVFKIKGETEDLEVNFWGSNGRLEAENLKANKVNVYHRSSNDMIVFPIEEIRGQLLSTGDLVLKNMPDTIDIEQIYTGQVIYP